MNNRNLLILVVALLALAALACNLPMLSTPTPIVFPTPNLTMTAVFFPAPTALPTQPVSPSNTPVVEGPTATTLPPTSTLTAVPTSTFTQPPPTLVPTRTATATQSLAGPGKRPKFSVVAIYMDDPPDIDGSLDDWNQDKFPVESVVYGGSRRKDAADLSGRAMLGWDEDYLYVGVRVLDDKYVQNAHKSNLYKGDSLEILLDTNVYVDYYLASLSSDDYQMGLSPGSPEPGEDPEAYLWYPSDLAGRPSKGAVDGRLKDDGYIVEAAIPWFVFNTEPYEGAHFGFCLSISDNDDPDEDVQQSMVSNDPIRMLTDPTTWGDLELVD